MTYEVKFAEKISSMMLDQSLSFRADYYFSVNFYAQRERERERERERSNEKIYKFLITPVTVVEIYPHLVAKSSPDGNIYNFGFVYFIQ